MKVICAGAPKTGTKSIAKALRILGYNPVYDAEEAIQFAFDEWEDVWKEKEPDLNVLLDTVYADVEAVVDLPHSAYFDVFLERWPDAKVILSTRDADSWFQSFKHTLERGRKDYSYFVWLRPFVPSFTRLKNWTEYLLQSLVGGPVPHAFIWKSCYKRHNAYVRATVPEAQLLEYNVTQGWKPLCAFLGKCVPENNFPFENRANDVQYIGKRVMDSTGIAKKIVKEFIIALTIIPLVLVACLAWLFVYILNL